MRTFILLLCMTFSLSPAWQVSAQTIIYVDSSRTGGANSGDSWVNAYTSLQTALSAAIANDSIWVAKGTYYPSHNISGAASSGRDATFYINRDSLKLYGGFEGTENSLTERDIAGNITILSGDLGVTGDSSDNTYHVFYLDGTAATGNNITNATVVSGFTLSSGNADGGGNFEGGGGAAILNGRNGFCSAVFTDCNFRDNSGSIAGAMGNVGDSGGVCSPILVNCSFSGNTSSTYGGAIFNYGNLGTSNPVLRNCSFLGNRAPYGGAVCSSAGSGVSSPVVINCSFTGNTADVEGAALANVADSGGTSSTVLTNCSFLGNDAGDRGTILNFEATDATVSLNIHNSIILGNSSGIVDSGSTTVTIAYSLVQGVAADSVAGNLDGTSIISSQVFVDTIDYTSAPTTTPGDFRLKNGSPAIDMGLDSLYEIADGDGSNNSLDNDTDLGGEARLAGVVIDMGAFEFDEPLPVRLQSFTANKEADAAQLRWTTASEESNTGFAIERSANGQNWADIAFVITKAAKGNGSEILDYSYTDLNPLQDKNFYRLRQVDMDGRYEYSPVRMLLFGKEQVITLYPNPAKDAVTITGLNGVESLQMLDVTGRMIYQGGAEEGRMSISLKNFPEGIYHVRVIAADGRNTFYKLVRSR